MLETTLDDKTARTVDGAGSTQFGKKELSDVLVGSLHALADLGNVCKDGLLVAFSQALWRRDLVALAAARSKVWVVQLQLAEEAGEEEGVFDGGGVVVLPDAGSLVHVAVLGGLGSGSILLGIVLVGGASLCELGLEVVGVGGLDLLLLLFLEGGWVEFGVCGGGIVSIGGVCLGLGLLFLFGETLKHGGHFVDVIVGDSIWGGGQCQRVGSGCGADGRRRGGFGRGVSVASLTTGVGGSRVLVAVGAVHLGDLAVAVDDGGAFGESNALSGLALRRGRLLMDGEVRRAVLRGVG